MGLLMCLVPHGYPGSKFPAWREVRMKWNENLGEGNNNSEERGGYPEFLKGCRNVFVKDRDFYGAVKGGGCC